MRQLFQNRQIVVPVFFLFLFLTGIIHMRQYPVDLDEASEQRILWTNLQQYREILHPEIAQQTPVMFHGELLWSAHHSVERDHGTAMLYGFFPVLENENISSYTYGLLWHCYLYMIFCTGTVFFYLFLKRLFQREEISLLGTAFYFLAPRLFASGLHNNKDMVFLTTLVILMYFGILMNEGEGWGAPLLFAVAGGFTCNTRSVGFLMVAFSGGMYILRISMQKRWKLKNFFRGLAAAVGTVLIYVVVTPATIYDRKLHLIEHIQYCLHRSTHFNGWWAPQLFEGTIYDWYERSLPWYYIPKYICITTPPVMLVLFGVGIVGCAGMIVKRHANGKLLAYGIGAGVCVMVPVIAAIVSKSVLYNGWRHFYFLHGYLMVIVCLGIYFLTEVFHNKWKNSWLIGLTACALFYYAGDMVYQIGGEMYFNVLAGKEVASRYEMDYYGVTGKEILYKLMNGVTDVPVYVYVSEYDEGMFENAHRTWNGEKTEKIVLLNSNGAAQNALSEGKNVYWYFNPVYAYWFGQDEWMRVRALEAVCVYKPWGRYAGAVYMYSDAF